MLCTLEGMWCIPEGYSRKGPGERGLGELQADLKAPHFRPLGSHWKNLGSIMIKFAF